LLPWDPEFLSSHLLPKNCEGGNTEHYGFCRFKRGCNLIFILRKEPVLRGFEEKLLRKIIGSKRKEESGGCSELYNERFYSALHI
jgi:hypothetical protein